MRGVSNNVMLLSLLLVLGGILAFLFMLTEPSKVALGTSFIPVAVIPLTTWLSQLGSRWKARERKPRRAQGTDAVGSPTPSAGT